MFTDKFGRTRIVSGEGESGEIVKSYSNNIRGFVIGIADNITKYTIIPAQGQGKSLVIKHIKVTNGHATVGTDVQLLEDNSIIEQHYAASLGGGWSDDYVEGVFILAPNTALRVCCITTGALVNISAKAEVWG